MKTKRALAMIALLAIILCILVMIISAFSGSPNAENYLMAALFCMFVIPAILYGYFIIIRHRKDK